MALLFGFLLAFELSFVACNEMLQLPQLQLIAHKLNEQYEILQKQLMQQNLLEAKYEDLQKQLVQQKRLEAKFEELERQNNQMKDFQIQMEQKHNTLQQQLLEKDILLKAHVKQMEERYSELNSRLLLKDKQILSLEEQMKRFESPFKKYRRTQYGTGSFKSSGNEQSVHSITSYSEGSRNSQKLHK